MNSRVAIIGIGWTDFRPTSSDLSYKEMMYEAAVRAYADADVDPRQDIDSFVTVAEDFHEGTSIFDEYVPDQIGAALKSVHTIPGDGLHGLASAYMMIRTGQFDLVAVEGHSKASNILTPAGITAYAQDPVHNRPMRFNTHFVAGLEMNRYLHETGTTREQCAAVVSKNRRNAKNNPIAAFGGDVELNDIMEAPSLSWPLSIYEASQHADGAIVMVLASEQKVKELSKKPVWIMGVGWCNDSASLENRTWSEAIYTREAARMAYRVAEIENPRDRINFAEIDDTYAYKELQHLEALELCPRGKAGQWTEDGITNPDGDFPVNVSGGSLGMGHLLDATGLARALEVVLQLRGEAGSQQLADAKIGLAQSWRGVPTTSGAVAILSN
ncbi:MAG: acetyl-CoA acetyltransferase [Anaerolineales bacterium]|nr:acetyl-CoA acetyltransferase [Anaerolineales bacterium]